MLGFLARRLLALVPLVLGVVLLGFAIVQLAPGDPVQVLVGDYPAPPEYVKQVRERFGLDAPRWVQLGRYVGQVARGNLGHSFFYNQPVWDVLASRIGPTLLLMGSAMALAAGAGVLLGVASGRRPGSWADHVLMLLGLIGYSLPVFWLGPAAADRRLDPSRSAADPGHAHDRVQHVARRAGMGRGPPPGPARGDAGHPLRGAQRPPHPHQPGGGEPMDYLTTARAKGLAERVVVYKHALRNALIPVVTVMGLDVGHLVAGAVLTETVFAWPGLGRLIFEAILHRDYPVMLGGLLLTSVFVVVGNLLADLACALIDPRIRLESR